MDDQPQIYGLTAKDLPEGWTPLEATCIIKCLTESGGVALATRSTDGLYTWDRIGMLRAALLTDEDALKGAFESEDD